ncbi:hypothetical protein GXW82_18235 [Streptacidiphilus sp. 4-A2]|nr:hypothetical protein [Streptacidiphilus sp. 4-A2]
MAAPLVGIATPAIAATPMLQAPMIQHDGGATPFFISHGGPKHCHQ